MSNIYPVSFNRFTPSCFWGGTDGNPHPEKDGVGGEWGGMGGDGGGGGGRHSEVIMDVRFIARMSLH